MTADPATGNARETTTVNRSWAIKMAVFAAVLLVFGAWGLADALWIYPARGQADADFKQKVYLEALRDAGQLARASVSDPRAELAQLAPRERELRQKPGIELSRLEWLRSLKLVGRLTPAYTTIESPSARLDELTERFKRTAPPKALAAYDIPFQWFFVVVGFGGGLYLLLLILRVSRTVYGYEPATHRLHLPDGTVLAPSDIADFDKRKWDKFFVFLQRADGEPPVKLDLMRHARLEDWVLEMERVRFPERAREAEAAAATSADGTPGAGVAEAGDDDGAPRSGGAARPDAGT